ncbi:hypothetical protein NQZ79_g3738 [Umbelopsis isabellina]|nr:hypothetical protein NQZ79_g3738 [Umbelopsis isabellina]
MDLTNKYSTGYAAMFTYALWYAMKETNALLLGESSTYYDADFLGFDPKNPPFEAWGTNVRSFYPILTFVKIVQAFSFVFASLTLMAHLKINYKALQAVVVGKFLLDVWCLWELCQAVTSWPVVKQPILDILSTVAQPRFWFTAGVGGSMLAVLVALEGVNLLKVAYETVLGKKDSDSQEKKDQ